MFQTTNQYILWVINHLLALMHGFVVTELSYSCKAKTVPLGTSKNTDDGAIDAVETASGSQIWASLWKIYRKPWFSPII